MCSPSFTILRTGRIYASVDYGSVTFSAPRKNPLDEKLEKIYRWKWHYQGGGGKCKPPWWLEQTKLFHASQNSIHRTSLERIRFVHVQNLIEVIAAAHQTQYIKSEFEQRGGIILVASPGSLKTTVIKHALTNFPDAMNLSDLNVNTLTQLKESLINKRYSTLAFGELEKLYQRNPGTAKNIEGHLKAIVEEGFGRPAFTDQRMMTMQARALLIGGITPAWYTRMFGEWQGNGFARRFIWCCYELNDQSVIGNAIHEWRLIDFGKIASVNPANNNIPFNVTKQESGRLRYLLKFQPALESPYILLKKIYCVLKWKHGSKRAWSIVDDFGESLGEKGARLII